MRKLEALFGVLITTMAVTFGVEYIIAEPNQADVMLGLVRHSMTRASALRVGRGDSIRFSPHAGGADAQQQHDPAGGGHGGRCDHASQHLPAFRPGPGTSPTPLPRSESVTD